MDFLYSNYMLLALIALYVFASINGVVYYTYLWQKKEYRLDRMMDAMRTRTGMHQLFPAFMVVKLLLLIVGIGHYIYVDDIEVFFFYALAALSLEFFEFILRIPARKIYRPKRTGKALLIVFLSIILMLGLGYVAHMEANLSSGHLGLYLLVLSCLTGDLNSLVVGIMNPITRRIKRKIIINAKRKIAAYGPKVIGITGSYGKSSTKEFLYQILSSKYEGEVFKTPGNTNVDIGVAQVLLQGLQKKHKFAIIEMGAYKKGEIKAICDIVNPEIGVVTAVADQHLALFGSLKNIQEAKYELIQSLSEDGVGFFNVDSPGAKELSVKAKEGGRQVLTYATEGTAKTMALHVKVEAREIHFDIHGIKFSAPVFGKQNLPNILAAIAVAQQCGMTLQEISKAVRKLEVPDKIMNLRESESQGDKLLVIDDSYNANPDGVRAALDYLNMFKGYTKILVFPGMLELGPRTDSEHINVAEKIKEVCDFTIFTSSDFIKPLQIGLGKRYDRYKVSNSAEETLKAIQNNLGEKTVILFEQRGSQSVMDELLK